MIKKYCIIVVKLHFYNKLEKIRILIVTIIHTCKGQKTTKNRKNNYEISKSLSSLSRVIVLCLNPYFKKLVLKPEN